MVKTAILVDGGFYRRRAQLLFGTKTAQERADELQMYCKQHLQKKGEKRELYRIFYYDCPPTEKRIFHPLRQQCVEFGKTPLYSWTVEFFNELKKKRKFALRMGKLSDTNASYTLTSDATKKILNGSLTLQDLEEKHFLINLEQKGVDMKIGLDIASLSYKKQVDQIILISGDSDFVPAAKLARREGIDFILDPMGHTIKPDLQEHIDGIRSCIKNKTLSNSKSNANPQ